MKFMILFGQKLNETAFQIQKKKDLNETCFNFDEKIKIDLDFMPKTNSGLGSTRHLIM